jgi:hypothetical protein
MSKFLSDVARTEFDTQVKLAYQGGSKLRDTVEYRSGVVGDTYKFRLMGKGQGHLRTGSSSLVVPMDITHSLPSASLSDHEHPEYTDIFDQAGVNFDEKRKLTETIGKAMGRTEDQLVIDIAIAGTYNTTATDGQGFEIAAGGTGFTTAKLRELRAYYDDLEVEETPTIVVSGTGMQRLLANTETTSSDFNSVKALVNGEMNTFMGFRFVTVGARRLEGGLGGSGLVAYSWAPNAIGLASADVEKSMAVDWVPERVSWLCNGMLKAGSTIIDPEGTAKISFT